MKKRKKKYKNIVCLKDKERNFIFSATFSKLLPENIVYQTSPNSMAKCRTCKELITKGSLRLVLKDKFRHYVKKLNKDIFSGYKYYYCYKCALNELELCSRVVSLARSRFKRWIRENTKAIEEFKTKNNSIKVVESL